MGEPINGLYGHVFDENGEELSGVQEFEALLEFEKETYRLPGQFQTKNKVLGSEGTGSMTFLKMDSRLVKKIAENPTQKYNFIGKLNEPTMDGEEAVLYKGVNFDSAPLQNWSVAEMIEVDLDFTFDDFKYLSSYE
jgi:Phage tail tube protein